MLHLLGFNHDQWISLPTNPIKTTTIEIQNKNHEFSFFISENVLKFSQEHFDCFDTPGVFLEQTAYNQLMYNSTNHLQLKHFGDDIMVYPLSAKPRISSVTLSILAELPFYEVDHDFADRSIWGHQQGCEFLDFTCDGRF